MIVDTRKLSLMKERPKSTVLYLPTEFVKIAGFSPDQMVQVIFGDNEIKIVKDIKSVEI
jgi:intein-encoded DNA endonuclease-like protein